MEAGAGLPPKTMRSRSAIAFTPGVGGSRVRRGPLPLPALKLREFAGVRPDPGGGILLGADVYAEVLVFNVQRSCGTADDCVF
jgi:hypothetical protein